MRPRNDPARGVVPDRCTSSGAAVDARRDPIVWVRRAERASNGGAVDVPVSPFRTSGGIRAGSYGFAPQWQVRCLHQDMKSVVGEPLKPVYAMKTSTSNCLSYIYGSNIRLFLRRILGLDHGVGHPSDFCAAQKHRSTGGKSMQGFKVLAGVADTVIKAEFLISKRTFTAIFSPWQPIFLCKYCYIKTYSEP